MMAPSFSSILPASSAPQSSGCSSGSSSFSASLSTDRALISSKAMTDLAASFAALAVFFLAFASRSAACAASRAALMPPARSVLNTLSIMPARVSSIFEIMFMRPVRAATAPLTSGAAKPAMVALRFAMDTAKRSFSLAVSARCPLTADSAEAITVKTNALLASPLMCLDSLSKRPSASLVALTVESFTPFIAFEYSEPISADFALAASRRSV